MWFISFVILLLGSLLSSSALSEQVYLPLCYKNNATNRNVILLGVNHYAQYQPHQDGVVERMINRSNLVLFESTQFFAKDGIYRAKMDVPQEAQQLIRLDSFVDSKDIPELSKVLGVALSASTPLPRSFVGMFVDAILSKRLQINDRNESSLATLSAQISGSYNTESAAYVYAQARRVEIHDLETVSEMFGASQFEAIKKEVGRSIECTNNDACTEKYRSNFMLIRQYLSPRSRRSYDDVYQVVMSTPSFTRVTMAARNERMAAKMMTMLSGGIRALVLVGAVHIGGPVGLASKLEAAKFVKAKCNY